MTECKESFTFFWKIKNFSFLLNKFDLVSPSFFVQTMDETMWQLGFHSIYYASEDRVACYFERAADDRGPDEYELDYELAFLSNDGSVLHSEKYLVNKFKKGHFSSNTLLFEKGKFFMSEVLLIHDDAITIRCRMWNKQKPISQPGRCFAETQMETECRAFNGIVEEFSNTVKSCKNLVSIQSPSTEIFLHSMNILDVTNGKLVIEIVLLDKSIKRYRCKIFIKDVFGNKVKSGQGEFYDNTTPQCINLALSKECLMKNKGQYLPDDVLTIECEITFSTYNTTVKVNKPEYEFDYHDTQGTILNETNFSSKEHHAKSFTTLKGDWISLFREGILCDTALKTATETFPVHALVLSVWSPVFKSMFTTDMKEKTNNYVDIDDLDADTVRRMLLFMYSDTLDDLQYENAKSLYFAADKYNIVSLRRRCSNFLKQNLQQSNCCDTLLLADKHQDKDMKNAVQDFIAKNDDAVLFSNEWKNLEKNYPHLTTEVFRFIYTKTRRN